MKKVLVLSLVAAMLSAAVPTKASARGGVDSICLGLGLGALFGLAVSQPPRPMYQAPMPPPAYGMCWMLVPAHWENRWDMYRNVNVPVFVSEHYRQIPCQ